MALGELKEKERKMVEKYKTHRERDGKEKLVITRVNVTGSKL